MAPVEPQPARPPAAGASPAAALRVEVVYCPRPGQTELAALALAPGATVLDALRASGLLERHGLHAADLRVGVWCKAREVLSLLRDRDRVEIYRPLTVDPKEARRLRYKKTKVAGRAD